MFVKQILEKNFTFVSFFSILKQEVMSMEILEIKKILKERKITYAELSKMSGISESAINKIFGGFAKYPRIDTMKAIEQALGIENEKKSVMERPTSELVENFIREYSELFSERRFIEMAKLYKAVDEEVREAMLIYLVAFMNRQGINTETILGY